MGLSPHPSTWEATASGGRSRISSIGSTHIRSRFSPPTITRIGDSAMNPFNLRNRPKPYPTGIQRTPRHDDNRADRLIRSSGLKNAPRPSHGRFANVARSPTAAVTPAGHQPTTKKFAHNITTFCGHSCGYFDYSETYKSFIHSLLYDHCVNRRGHHFTTSANRRSGSLPARPCSRLAPAPLPCPCPSHRLG